MNLITTFIEAATADGSTLAGALRKMNSARHVNITNSRIREWERGDGRKPSPDLIEYMISIALPYLLSKAKVSKRLSVKITESLLLPKKG
jgi:hypothetical protein